MQIPKQRHLRPSIQGCLTGWTSRIRPHGMTFHCWVLPLAVAGWRCYRRPSYGEVVGAASASKLIDLGNVPEWGVMFSCHKSGVTLVVAPARQRVRIEIGIENDFQLHIRPSSADEHASATALAGCLPICRVGESAIVSDLELAPSVAEHLMNLGFVPGSGSHGSAQRSRRRSPRLPG